MPSIKLAVSGTGFFSRFHYRAWKRIPEIEIVAICNRSLDRAREFAAEFGVPAVFADFGEMLEQAKPDLVDIVTPPETHLAAIARAAKGGINVICQKPFCSSLEEAKRAVALADESGICVAVHENFRFQPWYPEIKALLEAGEFGEIYQATFNLRPGDGQGERAYLDRQPYFQQMERFLIHETGIHLIDVFRFLFGDVRSVYASLRKLNRSISGEDAGFAILDMQSGVRCVFDGNRLADHAAKNRRLTMGTLLIEGSGGTIRLDGDGRIWLRTFNSNAEREHLYAWQNEDFGGDCVYRFQRHVVDHRLHQRPLHNSAKTYLENLLVEEAVYASNQKGCRLSL
jgi:predicted dehydrogenase